MVCPGYFDSAELYVSGPLQVPYQTSGYFSACTASEFFFHSSQASAPLCRASAQISVPLMLGHTPPLVPVPTGLRMVVSPLLCTIAPMGDGSRTSRFIESTNVLCCSGVAAPPMIDHGCGSSPKWSAPIQPSWGPSQARRNHFPCQQARTASRCASALACAASEVFVSPRYAAIRP